MYYDFTLSTGSFETFRGGPGTSTAGLLTEPGWYWWPCFPGCLPDGDPVGPFPTEQAAIEDAQDGGDDDPYAKESHIGPEDMS